MYAPGDLIIETETGDVGTVTELHDEYTYASGETIRTWWVLWKDTGRRMWINEKHMSLFVPDAEQMIEVQDAIALLESLGYEVKYRL